MLSGFLNTARCITYLARMWMTRRPIVCEDTEENFWQLVLPYLPMYSQ